MASSKSQRKLVAILFADIEGYTALMQNNEALANQHLDKFHSILQEKVSLHRGKVINNYGDGCVCTFDSSVDAVHCANEVQMIFQTEPKIPVRLGLHSGDVFFRDDNVYGDSVNVASRIESIAIAGSVLFSERVFLDIRNHRNLKTQFIDAFEFKNVEEPLKIYALANEGLQIPDRSKITGKLKEKTKSQSNKKGIYQVLGLAAVLLVLGVAYFKFMVPADTTDLTTDLQPLTVAVFGFKNNTGSEEMDILRDITADRIINGISQFQIAKVITGETIKEYESILLGSSNPLDRMTSLKEKFNVNRVVQGRIYRLGGELLMECTITDPGSNEVLAATPSVKCDTLDPMKGIEEMREHILAALIIDEDRKRNLLLETSPPKFEAYKILLAAKEIEDDEQMIALLEEAIRIDSNYFEPKVLQISGYYNLGQFGIADSLSQALESKLIMADLRQRNLLNFYKALFSGKNNLVYYHLNEELKLAPFDLITNNSVMVLACDFINDVQKAFDIYDIIDEEALDYGNCDRCQTRLYIKMYMDLENNDPKNALRVGKILADNGGKSLAEKLRIRAFVRASQWDELDQYIENEQLVEDNTDRGSLYLYAARECRTNKNTPKFEKYLERAQHSINTIESVFRKGEINLLLGNFAKASENFRAYLDKNSTDIETWCMLAVSQFKLGNTEDADDIIKKVNEMHRPYQFGDVDYWLGRAYNIMGDREMALTRLKAAIVQGRRYGFYEFHNEHWLADLHDESRFEEILTYWQK